MGRKKKVKGGKLSRFVNTPEAMAVFRHVYEIPNDVGLRYVHWYDALNPATGDLFIPVVAIMEGGIRFPMDPLIVMGTVELNRRLGLELGIHDILRTYILHHNTKTEAYSLRPRDVDFTLVNGLSDTNRGFDEDYLIVSGEWFLLGHKCPTRDGVPDPRRRNPRKSLININSLHEAWESELCTDDHAQSRSAPLLLRYVVQTKSYLACRLVKDIQAARANSANLALPAIDIRELLDVDAPDMSGINLRNLLPTRSREGTSENVPAPSQPARSKRARVESSAGPSRPASSAQPSPLALEAQGTVHVTQRGNVVRSGMLLQSGIQSQGEGSVPLWAPRMEYRGEDAVTEADCLLPVSNAWSASVASALSQAVRLPLDMEEGSKLLLELEDRFPANKDHLAHANVLATKYQDVKKMASEAKRLADAADAKRVEAEESLHAALDSLTKAEDKLPGVCNEYYMDAWNDAIAMLNSGQTMLPPNPIKLPFPGATPPPHPETVLNSPPPQLGAVMVDLEEVESAEAAGPVDAGLQDAPDGGSAAPDEAGPNNL
uniref:Uncharacterized protein n=1 Tax=Fagus sylvatica TaxID=28930 RepID=A0A2N9F9C4_FAGSY